METDRDRETDTDGHRDKRTYRQRDRHRWTQGHKERQTQTATETEKQRLTCADRRLTCPGSVVLTGSVDVSSQAVTTATPVAADSAGREPSLLPVTALQLTLHRNQPTVTRGRQTGATAACTSLQSPSWASSLSFSVVLSFFVVFIMI